MKRFKVVAISAGLSLAVWGGAVHAGKTYDAVKEKGHVQCGVSTGIPGFSIADSKGEWSGIDVDMCKAVAAMVFGDASKHKMTPVTTQQRLTALQSGEIDVLTRNTTATVTRDATLGLMSAGTNYYDSQGIMVSKELGVSSAKELDGADICVQPGTTTELNLADWFRSNGLEFEPVVINNPEEAMRSYSAGRCDAFTTDKSGLATMRSTLSDPDEHIILPEDFSKEPLGPMVRQGDDEWFMVVRWALQAMLEAEEYGITQDNVDDLRENSDNPNIRRFLGVSGNIGKGFDLDNDWAYNIVKQVGNYGESFARNIGVDTPMKLERGLNAQWQDGGLMYAWPFN